MGSELNMNLSLIRGIIKEYKAQFQNINQKEIYKWQMTKTFQDHWDINRLDFSNMINEALRDASNLLDSGNYFAGKVVRELPELEPEGMRKLFRDLYDEEKDLFIRIETFKAEFEELYKKHHPELKTYQDHRAIFVYLAFRFPKTYFLYKFSMFKKICQILDYPYKPKSGRKQNISEYISLCNNVKHEIEKDIELLNLHGSRLDNTCYPDQSLNILTQDVIFATTEYSNVITPVDSPRPQITLIANNVNVSNENISFTPVILDFLKQQKENQRIGDFGEKYVLLYEQERIKKWSLKKTVEHVSKSRGDGLGYDILSYDENSLPKYIEVKTTKAGLSAQFFITRNELECSKNDQDSYFLYRLYNFDEEKLTADLFIHQGDLTEYCINPSTYKVKLKEERSD